LLGILADLTASKKQFLRFIVSRSALTLHAIRRVRGCNCLLFLVVTYFVDLSSFRGRSARLLRNSDKTMNCQSSLGAETKEKSTLLLSFASVQVLKTSLLYQGQ